MRPTERTQGRRPSSRSRRGGDLAPARAGSARARSAAAPFGDSSPLRPCSEAGAHAGQSEFNVTGMWDLVAVDASHVEFRAATGSEPTKAEFRQLRGARGSPLTRRDGNGAFSADFQSMGFDTIGVPEACVARGRMFYEVEVDAVGSLVQIGWAVIGFDSDDDTTSDAGVGDDNYSWGICGARRKKFSGAAPSRSMSKGTDWGEQWKSGSVVGVAVDAETGDISFGVDGNWDAPMGLAFSAGAAGAAGFYPAMSAMHPTRVVLNFGGRAWRYGPPDMSFVSVLQASGVEIVPEYPTADTAARVYNDLRRNIDVMAYVDSLSSAQLLRSSACEERQWELSPDGKREFLLDCRKKDNDNKPITEDNADYAVKGMNAVHVLARDCTNPAVFEVVLRKCGVEALLKGGGESFWGDPRDSLPVHYAAQGNACAQMMRIIVEAAGVEQLNVTTTDDDILPVHLAALSNDSLEIMQTLLELGGANQLGKTDADGELPIHLAAQLNKNPEVIKLMIEYGGPEQLSTPNENGQLALHLAARSNVFEVFALILDMTPAELVSADAKDGKKPLHHACQANSADIVRALVSRGRRDDLAAKTKLKMLPLHYAVRYNQHEEVVKLLLEEIGSSLSSQLVEESNQGRLAVHMAAHNENAAVVRLVVDAGAQELLTRKDSGGWLPVHLAARKNSSAEAMQVLVEAGGVATLQDVDPDGQTAFHFAAGNESVPVVEYLLHAGGAEQLHAKDNQGRTCMHLATQQRSTTVLEFLDAQGSSADAQDNNGRSPLDLAAASQYKEMKRWAKRYGALLGRYRIGEGPCVHRSATAVVELAIDTTRDTKVAIKHMKYRAQFEAEIRAVRLDKAVVQVLRWHTPRDQPLRVTGGQAEEPEYTRADGAYPYILVMEQGERSLHDACQKERFAGYDTAQIISTFRDVVLCTQELHTCGIIHADLKQRNILRVSREVKDREFILCDMDASVQIGMPVGSRTSSAYAPPELALRSYSGDRTHLIAHPSFDIWSLGVILFELCSGRNLFAQDTSNDELIELVDKTRLSVWDTISDDELQPVLANAEASPQQVADARNLIRSCLKGRPHERPTIAEILTHRLLRPDADVPALQSMRYSAFLSHAQADSSGTVSTLFYAFKALGLHCWLDMRQQQLTLEGMRAGVRDSRVFIFVLSERILASWFCQQEALCALDEEKQIQLIVEEEPRFHPFHRVGWRQAAVAIAVPQRIIDMVEEHLPHAVAYRRRDFEQAAMMREICKRNGFVLPNAPSDPWPPERQPLRVGVICNQATAESMLADLTTALAQVPERVQVLQIAELQRGDLQRADCVLLLLTEGVLEQPSLGVLQDAIAWDAACRRDRIVCVFSTAAGWTFGCKAQQQAPADVQACLNDHEAICYRPRDDSGPSRHEFGAMVAQVLVKLGAGATPLPVMDTVERSAPSRSVCEELAALRREKDEALARVAEQDAHMRQLETQLAIFKEESRQPS